MAKKRLITADVVAAEFEAGRRRISARGTEAIITPGAWSKGRELGVTFDQRGDGASGGSERIVDPSGVVVVRGRTVRLGRFDGAGANRNVGLLNLIGENEGSPMTAGIMSWSRADSFPWSLNYDEVDYVLEGTLALEIAGRKVEGRAGDVFYIPKGSKVVFGTPSRVRVFYVTYPANWAAATNAPPRPNK